MSVFDSVPVDAVRDYWNARPCNIRHSTHPVGTPEYFNSVSARKYFVEPHIKEFADFSSWKGKRVLEIGCGIGTAAQSFAQAGARYTGVDLSDESVRIARQRAQVLGFDSTFVVGNAEELSSLVQGEFDLVYSFGVIHHTPHPERVLQEARKLISADGTLKVMVYHRRSLKAWRLSKGRFWNFDALVAHQSEAESGCPITYTYTRKQAEEMLARCGFETTCVAVDHIFPYRVEDYVNYEYNKELWVRALPAAAFRRLERSFGWHLLLDAKPC